MAPTTHVQAVSDEIASIHRYSYERRLAAPVRTTIDDEHVTCRVSFVLTEAEQRLLARGEPDTFLSVRNTFQRMLSPALLAAVERVTGRRVRVHTSFTDLDRQLTLELFELGPAEPR